MLEIKILKNQANSYDLIDFIRDFRVVDKGDGSFINISRNQTVNEKLKKVTGLTNLDALFLSEKEIENLFQNCILPDFWVLCFERNDGSQVKLYICFCIFFHFDIESQKPYHKKQEL